jgi:lysophospholipase L1-like esterase
VLALWFVARDQQVVSGRRGLVAVTTVALGAMVVQGSMWHTAHPTDDYLYRGGLAVHALLTVPLIMAAVAPSGPVRAVLSLEPVRHLGVISYGAYLVHWPILLWLQQETELDPLPRFGVGLALTVVAAQVVYRVVELPFRTGRVRAARHRVWVALPASLAVAATIVAVTAWRQPATAPIDFAAAQATLDDLIDSGSGSPDGVAPDGSASDDGTSTAPGEAPVRLAAFGDSTALMTGLGIVQWAEAHPGEVEIVRGNAKLGCGLLSGGERRLEGQVVEVPDECDGWLDDWLDALGDERVDVAVVQLGAWEITDHRLPGSNEFRSIDDADYRALQRAALDEMIAALLERAGVVALIANPDVGEARLDALPPGADHPEYDPARSRAWRDLEYEAADGPDAVDATHTIVVDLASWIAARPDDVRLRPDGVHFSQETGAEVAEWLVPEILAGVAEVTGSPDTVPPTTTEPDDPEPLHVLLTGDSLMVDSAGAIEAALDTADPRVEVDFEGQPAHPRTEEQTADWRTRVEAYAPDVVVEYMGYWDIAAGGDPDAPYGTPGFAEGYRTLVLDPWFDHLESIGADSVVLGAAPPRNPDDAAAIIGTTEVLAEEVATRPTATFLPTSVVLTPDGYADILPDPRTGELERVRRIDGLHLCPDGAERVTDLLLGHLTATYHLTVTDDWRDGDWRTALPIDLAAECPPVG